MKMQEFALQLEFETDWHIGSGLEQPGGDDRLVRRDEFGLPFVPGKTITGMLRDAAETLAMGIAASQQPRAKADSGEKWLLNLKQNVWYRWVLWIFGDQPNRMGDRLEHKSLHDAQVSIRPAYLPHEIRETIGACHKSPNASEFTQRTELRRELFFSKSATTIGQNGRAVDKQLRQDEMVRRGLTLNASGCQFRIPSDGEQAAFVWNFLQLAVSYVERIGAKRRRGAGKVSATIIAADRLSHQELAAYFKQLVTPPDLPVHSASALNSEQHAVAAQGNGGWIRIPYQVTLETPLLVSQRTVGNVVRSLDFVPGTMLLPILSRQFGKAVGPEIVAGNLRALPAFPALTIAGEKVRGIPVPACFAHPKGEGTWFESSETVSNRMTETNDLHVKTFRSGFLGSPKGLLPHFESTPIVVNPHNTISEKQQRPTTDVGGVFSYEAIAAGTVLKGEFRVRKSRQESLQLDWQAMPDQISLGRSRKDDYGLAKFEVMAPESITAPNHKECDADKLTVWLVSDAVLRDSNLRFSPIVPTLRATVAKSLGLDDADLMIDENHAYLRQRRIESWHVGWGLPRSTIIAIAAGSCVRFRLAEGVEVSAESLAQLQLEGIGERKAEGYGEILVNHSLLDVELAKLPRIAEGAKTSHDTGGERTGDNDELIRDLERRVWRKRIKLKALSVAVNGDSNGDHPLKFADSKPNGAQGGLLRNLIRMPLESKMQRREVAGRLERLQRMRADKWPDGALAAICTLLTEDDAVWEILAPEDWPVLTQDGRRALKTQLLPEAVQILVQTCLKVHQRHQEKTRRLPEPVVKGEN